MTTIDIMKKQVLINELWAELIDTITHDLATPLATLQISNSLIEEAFDFLLQNYHHASQKQSIEPKMSEQELLLVQKEALANIKPIVQNIFGFLHQLHPFNQKILMPDVNEFMAIKTCVNTTIENYQFKQDEHKKRIEVAIEKNFTPAIDPTFIEYALCHIIHHTFYYTSFASDIDIKIKTASDAAFSLWVEINQPIDESAAIRMLDTFFIKPNDTAQPGLGYCRLALLISGGDIKFERNANRATFIFSFSKP